MMHKANLMCFAGYLLEDRNERIRELEQRNFYLESRCGGAELVDAVEALTLTPDTVPAAGNLDENMQGDPDEWSIIHLEPDSAQPSVRFE